MNDGKVLVPKWFHEKVSYERSFIVRDVIDAWIIREIVTTKLYVENPKKQEPSLFDEDTHDYISDNFRDLVTAIIDDYEVEEEQKYRVEDNDGRTILAKMTYSHKGKRFDKVEPYNELIVGYKKELTEKEIKDYDPKYWAFAVKVEELEEDV